MEHCGVLLISLVLLVGYVTAGKDHNHSPKYPSYPKHSPPSYPSYPKHPPPKPYYPQPPQPQPPQKPYYPPVYGYPPYPYPPVYPPAPASCKGQFMCVDLNEGGYPHCVHIDKWCDGSRDCANGADEQDCPPDCLAQRMMPCNDRRSCSVPCDGFTDCPTMEDERFCKGTCKCRPGEYQCLDGLTCIRASDICNGRYDCSDRDDEIGCDSSPTPTPHECPCKEGEYWCKGNKLCLPASKVCDGVKDCDYDDDERDCAPGCKCHPGQYLCLGGEKCIAKGKFCSECGDDDADVDCEMGEDEDKDMCNYPSTSGCD
ncbi:SCO-spondin-like [Mya arenaria]|uniref:SCO-spondin-like n=1 Tax=Mya arenaria TaxID=6604 RepID=UPI0022E543E4|nr:SCO-spondin-like [Mya arenaria]